jgi:hypothetical protein
VTSARAGIGRQSFEVIRSVPERDAAISFAVLMAAFKAAARAAEHERSGCHQSVTDRGAVLKTACNNDCNRAVRVPFFVGTILWPGGAHHVGHRPAVATREDARRRTARGPAVPATCQRLFQFDRNFCQDPLSRRAL